MIKKVINFYNALEYLLLEIINKKLYKKSFIKLLR